MTHPSRRALSGAALFCLAGLAPAAAQSGDPAAIVRAIFTAYEKDAIPKPPYTPAVVARMKRKEIDADIILDAQDIDVKNVQVALLSRDGDKAVVDAKFDSFNRKMHVRFDLRVVDGKWMIANLRRLAGGEDVPFDLREWLRLPPLT